MSESFHRFVYLLNEWKTLCYSVGGARALDEVRFIPLSRPRCRHQSKNPTTLIVCTLKSISGYK